MVTIGLLAAPLSGYATARGPQFLIVGRPKPAALSDWSRVVTLPPAAPILVTRRGGPTVARDFISADSWQLLVLNLTDPNLPLAAIRALRELAADHPEYFVTMRTSGSFDKDGVRIGREGLFVGGRKIAELTQIVDTFARSDVHEVRLPAVARSSIAGTLLGAWLGFSVGVVPALGGAEKGVAYLTLAGATALGGYLGHRASSRPLEPLVYRAR